MFNQLLPQRIDNTYRGHKLALWLFSLLLFMPGVMSLNTIFNSYVVLSTADGVPLETYTPAATRTAVSLFALLGLSNLMICLLPIVRTGTPGFYVNLGLLVLMIVGLAQSLRTRGDLRTEAVTG